MCGRSVKTFHWGSWRLARCIGIACCVLQSVQGAVIMKRKRVEVEAVAAPTAAISPCVCYFPNGVPPPESTATTSSSGHAEDIEFSMYSKPTGKVSTQNVLVGSRGRVDYVGSTASMEYSFQQPCSYAVGVYDKSTGKLQLLPVQGSKVLRMEARLHGLDYGASQYVENEPTTIQERLALNKQLVDSFGSTRRRRQLTAREEGVVRTEKIGSADALGKALEKGAQEAAKQGLTKAEVMARGAGARNLPPHHPEARTAASAYRLDEIIPPMAVDSLQTDRVFKAAQNDEAYKKAAEKRQLPPYVLGRLHLLRDKDRDAVMDKAQALAFLAALMNLLSGNSFIKVMPTPDGFGKAASSYNISGGLLREMLDLFYVHRMEGDMHIYDRPMVKKELLIAYILVVAQLIEGGGLAAAQFEALRSDLKMTAADLVQRFREVGSVCSPTSIKVSDGNGESQQRAYIVALLKDGGKTLAESFPNIKMGPKKK